MRLDHLGDWVVAAPGVQAAQSEAAPLALLRDRGSTASSHPRRRVVRSWAAVGWRSELSRRLQLVLKAEHPLVNLAPVLGELLDRQPCCVGDMASRPRWVREELDFILNPCFLVGKGPDLPQDVAIAQELLVVLHAPTVGCSPVHVVPMERLVRPGELGNPNGLIPSALQVSAYARQFGRGLLQAFLQDVSANSWAVINALLDDGELKGCEPQDCSDYGNGPSPADVEAFPSHYTIGYRSEVTFRRMHAHRARMSPLDSGVRTRWCATPRRNPQMDRKRR